MIKHIFISIVITAAGVNIAHAAGSQQWECALDLHQGDTGTLSLDRNDDLLQGMISITRNSSVFESEVSGSWVGDKINLTRLLDSDSSESMNGIVLSLGTAKVNIGGRYANNFQGVWSADCDLVAAAATPTQQEGKSSVQPSISSLVRPNSPNSSERVTFSTLASHPDGIEKVSFYLGNNEIHSCGSERCEFTHGPLASGVYKWRVEAVSKGGVKNSEDINTLSVSDATKLQNCVLSGQATGPSAPLAAIYLAKLYGPNNDSALKASSGFNNGSYEFRGLAAGRYQLKIDTQGDEDVLASPAQTEINCTSQSKLNQDIEFR